MKNWQKNLLFVLFSFLFSAIGIVFAKLYIRKNGNPLKQSDVIIVANTDTLGSVQSSIDTTTNWQQPSNTTNPTPLPALEQNTSASIESAPTSSFEASQGQYLVIVGRFKQTNNANNALAQLKSLGYTNAFPFKKAGLINISAGHFSKSEAQSIIEKLSTNNINAVISHE